jgi:Arc/MetJ-type ribon-helix-helix transcriptional regulator
MNIALSEETHEELRQRMLNGGYATPDAAIRAGLELLKQQESLNTFAPGELEAMIAEGERSIIEEGTLDGDEAFEERRRQRQALRAKSP